MKTFYCHNTKLKETEGWATSCKRGAVVIIDRKNHIHFQIDFGKRPKMRAWKTDKRGDLTDQII